jgi:hypothetical protein
VSERTDQRKRLNPAILNTALLDEIAERLRSIELLEKARVPYGSVEPIEKFNITSQKTHIARMKPWFSMSLINDDSQHSVYVIVNTAKSDEEHEVKHGETYNVDMHHGLIEDVLVWCLPNETATIRLVGVR